MDYESIRLNYEQSSPQMQAELQNYYDDNLSQEWEDRVLQDGSIHYDDVDQIAETAWEWYLEH